ncbi:MAG TPA: ribokinase [Cellulomonas sp.]
MHDEIQPRPPVRPITVVGSVNRDITLRVPHLPRPGETISSAAPIDGLGGKGANQAVAAARLGGQVRLVSAVGEDGAPVLAALRRAGVRVDARTVPTARTGSATVLVDDEGGNVVVVTAGANEHLAPTDVPADVPADGTAGTGGVLVLQLEVPDAVVEHAARSAAPGTVVVLNPAPYRPVPPALLARTDVLVLNETELGLLSGAAEPATVTEAHRLLLSVPRRSGTAVIATLGAEGALLRDDDGVVHAPGITVDAVDTVGAGDTFCGALAVGLARGDALADALVLAVHAATLAVLAPGAQGGMPDETEVRLLMERTGAPAPRRLPTTDPGRG